MIVFVWQERRVCFLKYFCVFMLVSVASWLTGCIGSGVKYDFDKQDAFMERFSIGMPRHEVEDTLEHLDQVALESDYRLDNGEVVLVYTTSTKLYGTFAYSFVFSGEERLTKIIPALLTD